MVQDLVPLCAYSGKRFLVNLPPGLPLFAELEKDVRTCGTICSDSKG